MKPAMFKVINAIIFLQLLHFLLCSCLLLLPRLECPPTQFSLTALFPSDFTFSFPKDVTFIAKMHPNNRFCGFKMLPNNS